MLRDNGPEDRRSDGARHGGVFLRNCRGRPPAHQTGLMIRNILSVDVEEYFHPTELVSWAHPDQWSTLPSLVEQETRRVLEIFDRHHVTGTFFVLGWVAHRYPGLIREIASRGHEIGCHSFSHR